MFDFGGLALHPGSLPYIALSLKNPFRRYCNPSCVIASLLYKHQRKRRKFVVAFLSLCSHLSLLCYAKSFARLFLFLSPVYAIPSTESTWTGALNGERRQCSKVREAKAKARLKQAAQSLPLSSSPYNRKIVTN